MQTDEIVIYTRLWNNDSNSIAQASEAMTPSALHKLAKQWFHQSYTSWCKAGETLIPLTLHKLV